MGNYDAVVCVLAVLFELWMIFTATVLGYTCYRFVHYLDRRELAELGIRPVRR